MKKNFVYQVMYQILTVLLPLITTPYISRVLGVAGVGIYSYAYTIASYFELFIALGMALYGNRRISQVRDDIQERDKTFWEIFSFRLIMAIVVIAVYIGYITTRHNGDIVFIVCVLDLLGVAMDISWFYFGIEKFKITTFISMTVRILSFIAILVFVKKPSDVWIYTLIISLSGTVGNLIYWILLFRNIKISIVKICWANVKYHIKPIFALFVPVLAISLYKMMDKIMLGAFTGDEQVGLYYSAEKVVNIPTGVITALTTVMMPRMSNLVARKEEKQVKYLLNSCIDFMSVSSVALCFGLAAVVPVFVPLFFGTGYEDCIRLITLLCPVTIINSFEQVVRSQCLTPYGKDKEYTVSTILGAIANLIFNFVLIPRYGAAGAVFGTLIAELTVAAYQLKVVGRSLPFKRYVLQYVAYSTIGLLMFIVVRMVAQTLDGSIIDMFIQVAVGASVYILCAIPVMILQKNVLWSVFKNDLIKVKNRRRI